jgi:hypothetical protein
MCDHLCHNLSGEVLACVTEEAADSPQLAPAYRVWLMFGSGAERFS